MTDRVCVIDIDETLVYSRRKFAESIDVMYEGRLYYTLIRPSAGAFLEELKNRGYRIMSLTQGLVPWQKACLAAGGLLHYFEDIYGWTENRWNHTVPPLTNCKWVLIDNLHHTDRTLEDKAIWLKEGGGGYLGSNNSIQCEAFYGLETEETSLLTLLPRIEELLA